MEDFVGYSKGSTKISIITYGILWRWLTQHEPYSSPIQRYVAIVLDEFSDLKPVSEEACRILAHWIDAGHMWKDVRVVVIGYAIEHYYIQNLIGNHAFVVVEGRKYTLERCSLGRYTLVWFKG